MPTTTELAAARSGDEDEVLIPERPAPLTPAFGLTIADLVSVLICGLLLVAFVPALSFPSWTPRTTLLVGAGLPGLVVLLRQALTRERAALAATVFVVVGLFSAVQSSAPRSSLLGFAGRDLSVLTLASAFGLWAIARTTSPAGRRALTVVFAAVGTTVAFVGIVQVAIGIETGALALHEGRPSSFMINPVYFGAMCGAVTLVSVVAAGDRVGWWHVAAFCSAAGCVLSGSRVAWAALVVLATAVVVLHGRNRLIGAAAAALGAVAGVLLDGAVSGGSGTVGRVSGATPAGGGGRWSVWGYALQAWAERPLLGHGIGLFRPSIQDRFTPEFAGQAGPGELERVWFDAHNVMVAVLVATGIIGLLVLASWLVFVIVQARGPLALAALAVASTWLLQPVAIHTLPLTMVLLGASMPLSNPVSPSARHKGAVVLAAVGSLTISSAIVIGDAALKRAVDANSYPAAVEASRWMPGDSVVASLVAQVARFDSVTPAPNARSLDWRRQTVDREPDRPFWWNELAAEYVQVGELDAAERAVDEALRLQPVNFRGHVLRLEIAVRRSDRSAVESQLAVLCELNPEGCGLTADDIMVDR